MTPPARALMGSKQKRFRGSAQLRPRGSNASDLSTTLQLESAIRKYNLAQTTLGNAVGTISGKVDTINKHIDNVLKEAPTKLQVSVKVSDADRKMIQDMFDKEHKWMIGKMQENIRQVNAMFVEERRKVQKRYKEYDGCYLGHYA